MKRSLGSRDKFLLSLGLLSLTTAIWILTAENSQISPWGPIYASNLAFWICVFIAGVSFIWASMKSKIHPLLAICFVLFALTIALVSLEWGLPFGQRDPWNHLIRIHERDLALSSNPYPGFHTMVILLSQVLAVPEITVLTRMAEIALVIATLGIFATTRRLSSDSQAAAVVAFISIPGFFAGFVDRPFTLALSLLWIGHWAWNAPQNRATQAALFFINLGLVVLHPFVAILHLLIYICGYVILYSDKADEYLSKPQTPVTLTSIFLSGLLITTCLILINHLAPDIVKAAILSMVEPATTSQSASSSGVAGKTVLQQMVSTLDAMIEALRRLSYVLALGIGIAYSAYAIISERAARFNVLYPLLSAAVIGLMFLGLAFFSPRGIGIFRLVTILPVILIPALIPGFRRLIESDVRIWHVALATLVLTSGVIIAYQSDYTGGNQLTATQTQVRGVDWIANHHGNQNVVGGFMTFWIIEATYGEQASIEWSPSKHDGRLRYGARGSDYSWNIQAPDSLYVIDSLDYVRANQSTKPVDCIQSELRRGAQIYDNGETAIYDRYHGTASTCEQ